MKSTKFAVGDKVMVVQPYAKGAATERAVVRIGRTLVYVSAAWAGGEVPYYIETGQERTQYAGGRVYTLQEWAEREERQDIVKRLRESDLRDTYSFRFEQIPIDKLRRILAILEES